MYIILIFTQGAPCNYMKTNTKTVLIAFGLGNVCMVKSLKESSYGVCFFIVPNYVVKLADNTVNWKAAAERGQKVTSLVARSSCGRCASHLRRIRGCDARIRREPGAYVTQMLRAKFAYDVRHVNAIVASTGHAPRGARHLAQ
jgi:hypothetical protein